MFCRIKFPAVIFEQHKWRKKPRKSYNMTLYETHNMKQTISESLKICPKVAKAVSVI